MNLLRMYNGSRVATPASGGGGSPASIAGGVLTLTGSGFGTKSTAAPLVYDDFSTGTNGATIAGNAPIYRAIGGSYTWTDHYNTANRPQYSTALTRGAQTKVALMEFLSGDANQYNNSLEIMHSMPNSGDEIYVSFWLYVEKTSTAHSRNYKPFVAYGNTGSTPSIYYGFGNPSGGDGGIRRAIQSNGYNPSNMWGGPDIGDLTSSARWIRFDTFVRQSTPGVADGAWVDYFHDPQVGSPSAVSLGYSSTSRQTRAASEYYTQFHFGSFHSPRETDASSTAESSANIYISDVYFDRTRQRVELSNSATWSSRTFSEVQPATAWSDTAITCRFNQGLFTTGQTAHAFVVSSSGSPTYIGAVTIP